MTTYAIHIHSPTNMHTIAATLTHEVNLDNATLVIIAYDFFNSGGICFITHRALISWQCGFTA